MTDRTRLEAELAEGRKRLLELAAIDTLSDDQHDELRSLTGAQRDREARLQAMLVADSDAARAAAETTTAAATQALAPRASIAEYLRAGATGQDLTGAERELSQEIAGATLGDHGGVLLPLSLLAHDPGGDDVRAATTTTTVPAAGPVAERPITPRVWAPMVAASMGATPETVPAGTTELLLFATGETAAMIAETTEHTAAAATITSTILRPKRMTAAYQYTVEAGARTGARLEAALTADLRQAMSDQMERQLVAGDGTGDNIRGLCYHATAPSDPSSTATWSTYSDTPTDLLDGIYANSRADVRLLLGVATYKHAAKLRYSSTDDRTDAITQLGMTSGGAVMSSHVPAAASNIQLAVAHLGMRQGDSVVAVWPALEVIRDTITGARAGTVNLTFCALWAAQIAHRPSAYSLLKFKLA